MTANIVSMTLKVVQKASFKPFHTFTQGTGTDTASAEEEDQQVLWHAEDYKKKSTAGKEYVKSPVSGIRAPCRQVKEHSDSKGCSHSNLQVLRRRKTK